MKSILIPVLVAVSLLIGKTKAEGATSADYSGWRHSGSIFLLTTADGANLDAGAKLEGFPALVRLNRDFFHFAEARDDGADVRFSTLAGEPLAYQIDEWDAGRGEAAVWVRVPVIEGGRRQEIVVHWGKADATSESSGPAVFNASNGYLAVWHMGQPMEDAVGTLPSKNVGTTASAGIVGPARHFAGGQGIFCGDKIPNLPSGGGPHSSEAWFRAEKSNTTLLGWGNEGGGRGTKVRMQLRSPPHVSIDSDFADVKGTGTLPLGQWTHVVHTYANGEGRVYVNGRLDGSAKPALNIRTPARLWIGGWYDQYDFTGDLDEVRISDVARSADWVRLEYENQKPLQTLAGTVVPPGSAFSVSPERVVVKEGESAMVVAEAGGAQKVYWILRDESGERVVAVDRLHFTFDAGRVTGDQSATLQFRAVYPNGVKTRDIPVEVREAVPDPEFKLEAPAAWDGRTPVEVVTRASNAAETRAAGAGELHYAWSISDIAVTSEPAAGKLLLTRAQNSGKATVTATIDNGGKPVTRSIDIKVTEPTSDPWVARTPSKDEKPRQGQFYARDDKSEGTLYYNGTLAHPADSVYLRVFADGRHFAEGHAKVGPTGSYALSVKIKAGLVHYKAEFGTSSGGEGDGGGGDRETLLDTVDDLVCGDVYLIQGQSNAEATAFGNEEYSFTSPWIRSFGSTAGDARHARSTTWRAASARAKEGEGQVGYWGMELAKRLVDDQHIPVCILNGAVGGTRIDQHQRNPADPEDANTIYGRLLWRVRQARLAHGVRGVLWHQGENDEGADGPTGRYGYETYRQYFLDLAAAWTQDYPNLQHYYLFQIWPKSCAMGANGSDNRLREVQRTLPGAFSRMSIMSTLGIDPPGSCHFPPAGYAEFARLICPLVERDIYGKTFADSITPPNLRRATFAAGAKDAIVLEFDQPVKWEDKLAGQFYLDGAAGKVTSGVAAESRITLKLSGPSVARRITYLDSASWSQDRILRGTNGIAALTFCDVPLVGAETEPRIRQAP